MRGPSDCPVLNHGILQGFRQSREVSQADRGRQANPDSPLEPRARETRTELGVVRAQKKG
ncbi:hypothetical protein THIOKS12580038 [Thiocapsa sp. KS1]|nr:hypothetical protein THIOKS12580038 [Thiocapsa sp. KS1]